MTTRSRYGPYHESMQAAESNVEQLVELLEDEHDYDPNDLDPFEILYKMKMEGVLCHLRRAAFELMAARHDYERTEDLAEDGRIVPDVE